MPKILITEAKLQPLVDQLRAVLPNPDDVGIVADATDAALAAASADAEMWLNAFRHVNVDTLRKAPHLRFIQQLSVGYENLDLAAISAAGILAANTPGANAASVAEHTVLLMLTLLRDFVRAEQATRANTWSPFSFIGTLGDLGASTVGLIGFGAIGQGVARRLRGFGAQTLYAARHAVAASIEMELGARRVSLAELLSTASIVSLHAPATPETYHLIGAEQLAQMRPGSLLINTARGELVDEVALLAAVERGHLGGAGLDVLQHEEANPFTGCPRVLVTPHIGGASAGAAQRTMQMAIDNSLRFCRGEQPNHLLTDSSEKRLPEAAPSAHVGLPGVSR